MSHSKPSSTMHSKVNAMLGGHDVSVRAVDGVDECIAKEAKVVVIKHRE